MDPIRYAIMVVQVRIWQMKKWIKTKFKRGDGSDDKR